MNRLAYRNKFVNVLLILALILLSFAPYYVNQAQAAPLTEASIRLDRMGGGIAANATTAKILVVFKPASTATEAKLKITWPTTSAFTVDATAGNHTVTDTGIPSTYQGESLTASGITSPATGVSGGDVTFTIPDVTAGTLYGFYITGGITNPATGDAGTHLVTITTQTSAPADIDATQVAVDTLSSATGDQVSVTATVPPSFNFAFGADQALALGTLSTGSVSTDVLANPIDVDTNAGNGYIAFIRSEGSTASLDSATTGDSISSTNTGSPVNCSAGSECYVVDVDVTGSGTTSSEYVGDTDTGGVIPVQPTYDEIATSTGPVNSDSITLRVNVAISPTNAAATDYTDTWQVVGAANF